MLTGVPQSTTRSGVAASKSLRSGFATATAILSGATKEADHERLARSLTAVHAPCTYQMSTWNNSNVSVWTTPQYYCPAFAWTDHLIGCPYPFSR